MKPETRHLYEELAERVELLSELLKPKSRAQTQRNVIFSLLRGNQTNKQIAKDLGVSVNAANIALHHLHRQGLVKKLRRGVYEADIELLLLTMVRLVEEIEKRRMEG